MVSEDSVSYFDEKYVKAETVEAREYQVLLSDAATKEDTLVVLPTGTGKTIVSLVVTARRLEEVRGSRSLLLAPTKPLVNQHAEFYKEALDIPDNEIKVFTGDTKPDDREELWSKAASVVIATPQVIENDLIAGRISLRDVTHLTFDECHRGTGDYAYTYIAEQYWAQASDPLVTGLSASPGSSKSDVLEICENLGISNVEIVTEDDPELEEYVYETEIDYQYVSLPEEVHDMIDNIEDVYKERLKRLKEIGVTNSARKNISMEELQGARKAAQKMIQQDDSDGYEAMSIYSEVMKLRKLLELLETQGVEAATRFLERQKREADRSNASKAVKRMLQNEKIQKARESMLDFERLHPKKDELRTKVVQTLSQNGQVIVFTESRDTASDLVEFIDQYDITVNRFVGQNNRENDPGMTQTEQKEVIEQFRNGDIEVLVATSVAEEGLDIPTVDLVLFYEPVSSAIRTIQRRGRTGRQDKGKVVVLIAEGTRDEGYFWASKNREEQMMEDMKELKEIEGDLKDELGSSIQTSVLEDETQMSLQQFDTPEVDEDQSETVEDDVEISEDEGGIHIIADNREMQSSVMKELSKNQDIKVTPETLEVGDYVVSVDCAVERKEMHDFLDTLTGGDRDLFEQLGNLASNYRKPVLLLEGDINELFSRNIHPNAIYGALTSIALDYEITLTVSRNEKETADYLISMANREQVNEEKEVNAHGKKATSSLKDEQEYVVSSIADVGPKTAKALLNRFDTVRGVMTAKREELIEIEGVGPKTADRILEVVTESYGSE